MVNAIRLLAYTLLSCLLELLKGLSCTLEEARERFGDNIDPHININPERPELDLNDARPRTEGQTDINLSSDEAREEEQDMDGCSEDAGKEAEFGEDIVKLKDMDFCSDDVGNVAELGKDSGKLKDLLKAVLMVFLRLIAKGNLLRDTMNSSWNGTAPCREGWKATLRSLADPSWLAGGYSQQQQVSAVPFTRVDEANADVMDLIRRRLVTPDLPIQDTGHDVRSRVESLAEDDRLPIQETGNDDRIESLAEDGRFRRLASSAWENRIQNLQCRELTDLEEENERLRRQRDCVLCLCKARDVLFMPCCHLVSCQDCSDKLTSRCCPICREPIAGTIRVYIS